MKPSSKACSSCFRTLLLWTGYTATQAHHKWALPRHLYLIKDSSFPLVCTHNVPTLKSMAQVILILWIDCPPPPPILAIFSYFNIFLIWGLQNSTVRSRELWILQTVFWSLFLLTYAGSMGNHSFGTPYLVSLISSYKNMEDFPTDFKRSCTSPKVNTYYVFSSLHVQVALGNVNLLTSSIVRELCPF